MNFSAPFHSSSVVDLHRVDLFEYELRAAILAQQTDRVGATLTAVAHHVHVTGTGILQSLQLGMRRTALPHQAVIGAMLCFSDERHHIVQEGTFTLDGL